MCVLMIIFFCAFKFEFLLSIGHHKCSTIKKTELVFENQLKIYSIHDYCVCRCFNDQMIPATFLLFFFFVTNVMNVFVCLCSIDFLFIVFVGL